MTSGNATKPMEPLSKRAVFIRRLASSLVLWTLVISALFSRYKS